MALDVVTKDCTQLSDAEMIEMADLCAEVEDSHGIGELSKQVEAWVLVTLVREGNALRGFSFSTLERIGGTPSVVLGMGFVKRNSKRDATLRAIMAENYRRALMAFPDEDVVVGVRMLRPDAFEAFKVLVDVIPRPGHKPSGEERAWGRRFAKRFGVDSGYDDQSFVVKGDGSPPLVMDHVSTKPEKIDAAHAELFSKLTGTDSLVSFGWVMAEELLKFNA
jgi:hypothetical protein